MLLCRIPKRTPDSRFRDRHAGTISRYFFLNIGFFPSLILNKFTLEHWNSLSRLEIRSSMSFHQGKSFPQPSVGSTQSFWRTELDPLDDHQTPLPTKTDILIIGGGYVGASAAYRLLAENKQEIPPRVTLVEARGLCSGASGRNGEPRPNMS
jgi:hypothetical protein